MNTIVYEAQRCGHCGALMPPGNQQGHCLRCLLQLGMDAEPAELGKAVAVADQHLLRPGDQVGHYQLIEQIGEGGCGVVFMAEQTEPVRRTVAVKVIRPGMDTRQGIARFEAERQALALLDHPNIPKVFDAGVTESGRHFFVMELVRGVKITDYCDREKLCLRQRLQLFEQVCQTVQHAHQKGLIHRDLKPANILVTEESSDAGSAPKIIDFGIVKSTDQSLTNKPLFTAFQQCMGTPAYMSPEQAGMGSQPMDARSDVYSLGALLYELLSGVAPFDAAELERCSLEEVLRFIRQKEPPRPSLRLKRLLRAELSVIAELRQIAPDRLTQLLRGDMDWIVMKCLEKDRNRRYETVFGLMTDLKQYLHGKPIMARPSGNCYRFQKMISRNQVAFATAAAVILVLPATTSISIYQMARARQAEREQAVLNQRAQFEHAGAEAEAAKNREMARFLGDILKGVGPATAKGRDITLLREILDQAALRMDQDLAIQPEAQAELRNMLSETYHELGLYRPMEEMARKALQLGRSKPGEESATIATALAQLGDSLMHQGELNAAETFSRQALEMRKKLLGPENRAVSVSLSNLALVLRQKGHWSEAEKLARAALAMDRRLLGGEHPQVAIDLGNLGATLWSEGKLAEAETSYRAALRLQAQLSGGENPETAMTISNLAIVLARADKLAPGKLNREMQAMDLKFLGGQNPDTAAERTGLDMDAELLGDQDPETAAWVSEFSRGHTGQEPLQPEAARTALDRSQPKKNRK